MRKSLENGGRRNPGKTGWLGTREKRRVGGAKGSVGVNADNPRFA